MAKRDGAASIQGSAIKITPLHIDGTIDPTRPILTTNGFITASFGTEFEDGDEITEKAADGSICISYKADDSLKDITFNLSLCSPDPEAAALLAGGKVIVAVDDVLQDPNQPAGPSNPVVVRSGEPIGYTSPAVGAIVGNPVAVEIWSKAIVAGKPALGQPYWHWAFPYVRVRYDGDREFTNGALANEFSGTGVGNEGLVPLGLNPANPGDDFVTYREALVNPFSYVRTATLPTMGWSGGAGNAGEWTWSPDNALGPGFTGTGENKAAAKPGDTFSEEPTITAQDSTNAAKLVALGYIAAPASAWTENQGITIGFHEFSWTGTAWQAGRVPMSKAQANPGDVFPAEPTVTAQDATNAAKLTGLGYTAVPATAWTSGQGVRIGAYTFSWTSTAWQAGAHA